MLLIFGTRMQLMKMMLLTEGIAEKRRISTAVFVDSKKILMLIPKHR
jgi:UDP-N-acetylglucosamine 2-epimerase